MNDTPINCFDGSTKIVFSNTFNVYEDKLAITPIYGFTLIFVFATDTVNPESRLNAVGDNANKSITITITNFSNSLGSGTTNKIPIITNNLGKQVYYSMFVSSLGGNSTLKHVTITIFEQL